MEYEEITEAIIGCAYRIHPVEYVPSGEFNRAGSTCPGKADSQYGNSTFPYKDHLQNHLGQND